MSGIPETIRELEAQKDQIDTAIRTLRSLSSNGVVKGTRRGPRKMSAEGRRRIAEAQKKRWAKAKAEAKK